MMLKLIEEIAENGERPYNNKPSHSRGQFEISLKVLTKP